MRGIIIIISSGILLSIFVFIYNMIMADSRQVTMVSCLILILIWLTVLIIICIKGRQWKQGFALLEEHTRQEFMRQEQETDRQLRDMEADVVWLKCQIAHGVRMPLAIISGYGDLLKKGDYSSKEEAKLYMNKICSNIDYLNQTFRLVIDDDAGKMYESNAELDLLDVTRSVVEYTENFAKRHGVRLELNSSYEQVLMRGNRIDIMKLFYNLIENSLRYMQHGDAIHITVEEADHRAWIVYRDNGAGVTKQDAEQLMAWNCAGTQTQQKPDVVKGSGMGMYLVKDIIQKHQGTLQVKGGTGAGFAMYITFPLADDL